MPGPSQRPGQRLAALAPPDHQDIDLHRFHSRTFDSRGGDFQLVGAGSGDSYSTSCYLVATCGQSSPDAACHVCRRQLWSPRHGCAPSVGVFCCLRTPLARRTPPVRRRLTGRAAGAHGRVGSLFPVDGPRLSGHDGPGPIGLCPATARGSGCSRGTDPSQCLVPPGSKPRRRGVVADPRRARRR